MKTRQFAPLMSLFVHGLVLVAVFLPAFYLFSQRWSYATSAITATLLFLLVSQLARWLLVRRAT